jgi:hypothetical protein
MTFSADEDRLGHIQLDESARPIELFAEHSHLWLPCEDDQQHGLHWSLPPDRGRGQPLYIVIK